MQISQFIEYLKARCLDLQFIFCKKTTVAKDISKTILFVNGVLKICRFIYIIIGQM